MVRVIPSLIDFAGGDEEPETEEDANLLDPPPRFRSARFMRLVLKDFSFLTFLAGLLSASSLGPMLSVLLSRGLLEAGISAPSTLLSTLCPESGESAVGDAGGLINDCFPWASSRRRKAVTAVHPEWILPSDSSHIRERLSSTA